MLCGVDKVGIMGVGGREWFVGWLEGKLQCMHVTHVGDIECQICECATMSERVWNWICVYTG